MVLRMNLPLFVIAIYVVLVFRTEAMTSDEEELCSQCTMKCNNSLSALANQENFDVRELTLDPPCTPCEIRGLGTLTLAKEICPKKVDGEDNCYDHPITFLLKELSLVCTCTLPYDPKVMLEMLAKQQSSGSAYSNQGCAKDGKPPIDPAILLKGAVKLDPVSLLALTECRPLVPVIGKAPPTEVSGGMKTFFTNFQMAIMMRACEGKEGIEIVEITRDESVDTKIRTECVITDDESFAVPCKCLGKTDFFSQLLVTTVSSTIPCNGGEYVGKEADITKKVVCLDLIDD